MNTNLGEVVISIITPAYNEENNLVPLYKKLVSVMTELGERWNWILIDDHSDDDTFKIIKNISRSDPRVTGVRLSRNSGSHVATTCGLHLARGNCAICLAADLQDPPELIPDLFEKYRNGASVVWARRTSRSGEIRRSRFISGIYYWTVRNLIGIKEISPITSDYFLVDRLVLDAFKRYEESNVNVFVLICSMGFRQDSIAYTKMARGSGVTGWTLGKKFKLFMDTITGYGYFPIRFMTYLGILTALCGISYAIYLLIHYFSGKPLEGWTSIMVGIIVLGGAQIFMLGVLGEYIWRNLDQARKRPLYLVEDSVGEDILNKSN